jgi:hypothetical protein
MVYTADGDDISLQPTTEEAFVKVMERRARNPELEHIAYVMQQNMEKRLEQQAHEFERLFTRRLDAQALEAERAGYPGNAVPEPTPPAGGTAAPSGAASNEGATTNEAENNGSAA